MNGSVPRPLPPVNSEYNDGYEIGEPPWRTPLVEVRKESLEDPHSIRELHWSAFPNAAEATLVDRLRADGDSVISVVAAVGGTVVGHALFSRMDAPFPALGLGPVAVSEAWRRRGAAAALIRAGLEIARSEGWVGVFVLGDPAYYRRFGFTTAEAAAFDSPFAGPHFMAMALTGPSLPAIGGAVDYAPAFAAL
jgi:putative acetyltransferase